MVFKNQKELENFLLQKCKIAIIGTETKIHNIIDKCLKEFYAQFEPEEYIRTEQLLHSLVMSGVKKSGNGYEAEVYFDVDRLNYPKGETELQSGRKGYANWDKDTILDVVMTGSYSGLPHGGYAEGTAIWSVSQNTIEILGGVYKMIEEELKAQGIPLKKG